MTKETIDMTKKTVKVVWAKLTEDMIDRAIVLNGNSSDSLQLNIHRVLVAIAEAWKSTGDQKTAVARVNAQIERLGDGTRKQAIVAWVCGAKQFGMLVKEIEVATDGGKSKTVKVIAAGKVKAKNLDLKFIVNSHWWTFTKEPEFKAFDLVAKITALLVEADKVVKRDDKRQKALPSVILKALRDVEAMKV